MYVVEINGEKCTACTFLSLLTRQRRKNRSESCHIYKRIVFSLVTIRKELTENESERHLRKYVIILLGQTRDLSKDEEYNPSSLISFYYQVQSFCRGRRRRWLPSWDCLTPPKAVGQWKLVLKNNVKLVIALNKNFSHCGNWVCFHTTLLLFFPHPDLLKNPS